MKQWNVLLCLLIQSKVLSALVAQLVVDFVKISSNVFTLVFGMFGQLHIWKLVRVYSTNLVGDRNVELGPVCRSVYR
jgi:hypothetical protein